MYKVIGSRASRGLRVLWMLEELGQPYEHVPAKPRSDEALAANPSGKIPALQVDGETITDSVAIMTYLADRHGVLTYGAGTLERARQDALTLMILDEVEALVWMAARHSFVLPEAQRMPEVKKSLKWEYEQVLPRLEAALTGPFLTGEMMTIPDMLLAHCLSWAERAGFAEAPAKLADLRARMEARDAFQRVLALP
ncbi:MAG: glutathione S-transferase family protein [Roseovarius sp.]|uniref:glutathione S-transferase family protein n=1 Tax=Roseovarius sp. TaxID=1486281 RepID=UPI0032ED842B